jgi:hypothetical protein
MLRFEKQSSPVPLAARKSRRLLYALVSAVIVVIILSASFIVAPPGETMDLRLKYNLGEGMTYERTEVIVNRSLNTTDQQFEPADTDMFNSTVILKVVNGTSGGYIINENGAEANVSSNPLLSVLLPAGGPLIFWNASISPTLGPYLEETSVRTGDIWTLPLDCANASLGLTGQVTVAFAGIEEVTVPAGTYRAIRIEVTSSRLTVNPDSDTPYQKDMTLQFNATTYLEQTTCRLIKTELSQETHLRALDTENTATVQIEEILIQHTKP